MDSTQRADFDRKIATSCELLTKAASEYRPLAYANSLGAEAMVLMNLIRILGLDVFMFTIDTGRLPAETYGLMHALRKVGPLKLSVVYPNGEKVSDLVSQWGINGFYESVAARTACCEVRKLEPFRRVIADFRGWLTGVRSDQSERRATLKPVEWDDEYGLYKISPLLDWSEEEIWAYIRENALPYNPLHDRSYPSIGCAPCTRAIQAGEPTRAGRWWWEHEGSRECGLHPHRRSKSGGEDGP
ncbi:MAG: phosphoadenylyl-sulfate reductase [Gallionella sp.]|jgi:phosphoadenosine phosphosulfate reductase|nr:phosphoadenylyl-sulfate reductase [Gallionella sp.]